MIRFQARTIQYGEIWFDEPVKEPLPDILIRHHCGKRPPKGPFTVERSLIADLTESETVMWEKIGKTCRYKIRRSETKDAVACSFDASPSEEHIDSFVKFYDIFAAGKSLNPLDRNWIEAIVRAGRLRLTRAEHDGTTLVRHSYIVAGGTARLLQTASLFRDTDAEQRAVIGRANRLLHWRDMTAFKDAGLERYDWGGIFENESTPERKGINEFKREFGGTPTEYFGSRQAISIRGQLYSFARELAGSGRAMLSGFRGSPAAPVPQG
jgi:hypothetical protein